MIAYKLNNGNPCKMKMCDCACNPSDKSVTIAKLAQETIDLIFNQESIEQMPSVVPEFKVLWKNIRTEETSKDLEIIAENGDVYEWIGSYVWYSKDGYSNPYKLESNVFETLTSDGEESETKETVVEKDTQFNIKFYSFARTQAEVTSRIKFHYPVYYGKVGKDVTKHLVESASNTLIVTTAKDERFVYKYPVSLPKLENVIMNDGLDVLQAFVYSEEPFVTDTGINTKLRVYTSVNPGAFTNAKLSFK